jgi:HEXXH motif-containing protein
VVSRVEDMFSVRNHRLSVDQFQELCEGVGSAEVVRELRRSQRSRRLLLIDEVIRTASHRPALMGPLPPAESAWEALAAAGDCDDVLLHPQVGGWAAYALRRHRGRVSSDAPLWIDFGVLHTVALVAAARTGLTWQTRIPARNGRVMLPTLGMADVGGSTRWTSVPARCAAGVIYLTSADGSETRLEESAGWWPLRTLGTGRELRLSVFLDDLDPYRDLADPIAPARLDDAAVGRWQTLLDEAWSLLCRWHRPTAESIAEGMLSLVPLPAGGGETRSASSGEAFGGVLVSPPADGTDLAVSLVHEFQHIKLGALIHLGALTGGPDDPVLYAPWRDDPRPLGGILQGIYAFTGIAAFWRGQRLVVDARDRPAADFEYAYARDQVDQALAVVADAGGLTDWGRAVADGIAARLRSWQPDRLAPATLDAAALLAAIHRAGWRLRHVVPAADRVRSLASAWLHDDDPPTGIVPSTVRPSPALRWSQGWQRLIRRSAPGGHPAAGTSAPAADVALASGDLATAEAGYRAELAERPGAVDAWTGLAIAVRSAPALRRRPELIRAVYLDLVRRDAVADPVALARWLAPSAA